MLGRYRDHEMYWRKRADNEGMRLAGGLQASRCSAGHWTPASSNTIRLGPCYYRNQIRLAQVHVKRSARFTRVRVATYSSLVRQDARFEGNDLKFTVQEKHDC